MSDVKLSTWVKPNGKEMQINDNAFEGARAMGWLPAKEYKEKKAADEAAAKAAANPPA